jgi:hypothetical protein
LGQLTNFLLLNLSQIEAVAEALFAAAGMQVEEELMAEMLALMPALALMPTESGSTSASDEQAGLGAETA